MRSSNEINDYKGSKGVLTQSSKCNLEEHELKAMVTKLIEEYGPECRFVESVVETTSGKRAIRFTVAYSGETRDKKMEAFQNWLESRGEKLREHFDVWRISKIKPKYVRPIVVGKRCDELTFEAAAKLLG